MQGGHPIGHLRVDAEVAKLLARQGLSNPEDKGVVAVEDDDARGLTGQRGQEFGRRVDLGEPVELVARHVEQQGVGWRDELGELQSVPFVELKDRDVGGQLSTQPDLPEHRRQHPAGEVAAGGIGENPLPVCGDDRRQHFGRRRLAVGPRDDHDPARHAGQGAGQQLRVDPLGDQPG